MFTRAGSSCTNNRHLTVLVYEKTKNLWGCRVTTTDSSEAKNRCMIYHEGPAFFPSLEMQDKFRVMDSFRSGTETYKWNQARFYLINFPQNQHFLDKRDMSPIRWSSPAVFCNSVAIELSPCFSVLAFQICKRFFNSDFWSTCTKCWCGNQWVAFSAWLLVELLQLLLLVEERALNRSRLSFQPNPS